MKKEEFRNIFSSSSINHGELNFLFEENESPLLIHSASGDLLEVNSAACDFYGYSKEAFLRLDLFDIVPTELHEELQSQLARPSEGSTKRFTTKHLVSGEEILVGVTSKWLQGKNKEESYFITKIQSSLGERQTHELTKCEHSLLQSTKAISRLLIRENDMESLLNEVAKQLYSTNGYRDVSIALLDEETNAVKPVGFRGSYSRHKWSASLNENGDNAPACVQKLIRDGKTKVIENKSYCENCNFVNDRELVKCLLIPLEVKNQSVGLIKIVREKSSPVAKEEIQLLREIADDLAYARTKFKLEEKLRESEKLLSDIFHAIQDGISLLSRDFEIIRANQWYQNRYSDQTPLKGKTCYEVYHDRESICPNCPTKKTFQTGRVSKAIHSYPKGGEPNEWHELFAFPIKNDEGEVTGVVKHVRNITSRKKAEQKLRENKERLEERKQRLESLYSQLKGARERERKRISRHLHDEMGQSISAAILNLSTMETMVSQEMEDEAGLKSKIEETRDILDETDNRVKQLALDLRPKMLDELGLVPALRAFIDRYDERHEVDVKLKANELSSRLDREIETAIYRVSQEALTNIAKHAKASTAEVTIEKTEEAIFFSIEDDGIGFDPEEKKELGNGHLGLISMKERLDSVGGTFNIDSAKGEGVSLESRIPLKDD